MKGERSGGREGKGGTEGKTKRGEARGGRGKGREGRGLNTDKNGEKERVERK